MTCPISHHMTVLGVAEVIDVLDVDELASLFLMELKLVREGCSTESVLQWCHVRRVMFISWNRSSSSTWKPLDWQKLITESTISIKQAKHDNMIQRPARRTAWKFPKLVSCCSAHMIYLSTTHPMCWSGWAATVQYSNEYDNLLIVIECIDFYHSISVKHGRMFYKVSRLLKL